MHQEGVEQILEAKGVLGGASRMSKVGDSAEGDHEVVIARLRMLTIDERPLHHLTCQINPLDSCLAKARFLEERAQCGDRVAWLDGPASDIGEHRSVDQVVRVAYEDELDVVVVAKHAIQLLDGGNAPEPTPEHDNPSHRSAPLLRDQRGPRMSLPATMPIAGSPHNRDVLANGYPGARCALHESSNIGQRPNHCGIAGNLCKVARGFNLWPH